MANSKFAQYLLNRGIFTPEEAGSLLKKSSVTVPKISVMALEKGLLDAQQAEKLLRVQDFMVEALDDDCLTALQLDELKKTVPNHRTCLGQVLLDEGLVDLPLLAKLFEESKQESCHPVDEVVNSMLAEKNADIEEYAYICDYVQLFVRAMNRFVDTDALLVRDDSVDLVDSTYLVYQNMGGTKKLTVGCRMTGKELLDMASIFSGEQQTEVNEMALNCIEEFCNVVNGHYIVNMSAKKQDMDLDMPHTVENAVPMGDNVFSLRIETEFGALMLYISEDGFVLNEKNYFGW